MPILAIEDDAAFAELLRFWLAPREVRVARTMSEAEEMIAALSPKVLLLDLKLPDSTPDETVAKIEKLKSAANDATVIVITGYANHKEAPPGAAKLLNKDAPGFFDELDASIVKILEPLQHANEDAKRAAAEVRGIVDP